MESIVSIQNLTKKYFLYKSDFQKLKGLFFSKYHPEEFLALDNISFEIQKGEIVGIVGLNGSGKTTLSSIITGMLYPTEGIVKVNGSVNMLAATAGLSKLLTGIENIEYKCTLMGLTKNQIREVMSDMIDFADIGNFIEHPLWTYSSGMRSRLGFAISIFMNPDILIIDEGLSVGDSSFTDKCMVKMSEMKENQKTIVFISHSVEQMQGFCDYIIWLHRGTIVGIDKPEKILPRYKSFTKKYNKLSREERLLYVPNLD